MIDKQTAKAEGIKIIDSRQTLTTEKQALIAQLKAIIPNVINADNQLDIKALQDIVDSKHTTSNNQGYELTFAGKGMARAMADSPTDVELKTEIKQSKNFDDTENVLIRGDNLEVLKILQANYHKKIKMIYIDPPYNTKSENFIYKDNFKKSDENLINDFSLDEESVDFLHNVYGTRTHSGWLSFIYPRLKLARDLLTDDGAIFISIDDNEQANLKILCDEIFGEDNFINKFVWKKNSSGKTVSEKYPENIDYIFMYSKGNNYKLQNIYKPLAESTIKMYSKDDGDGRGKYATVSFQKTGNPGPQTTYNYIDNNEKVWKCPKKGWRLIKEKIKELENDERVYFSGNTLREKDYWNERESEGQIADTLWDDMPENNVGTAEVDGLLGKGIFTNPKPMGLIERCIKTIVKQDEIILDFFAGSGTTADAVMQLNAEDDGNRKFVLVQLDEPIDKKKSIEAHKFCTDNNFAPVISSITIERLNRAGDKIKADFEQNPKGLFGDKKLPDIGYKVFSCTQKPQVSKLGNVFEVENNRIHTLDTLINMLVATCKTLDTKIECLIEDKLYKAGGEIYLLAGVDSNALEKYQDLKINLDGWADINLTQYLNLGVGTADNISVIY